jgi:hypothetical protein
MLITGYAVAAYLAERKSRLSHKLLTMLIDEFQSTPRDQLPALLERRPVIKFFLERIEPVLNRAIPAGREI